MPEIPLFLQGQQVQTRGPGGLMPMDTERRPRVDYSGLSAAAGQGGQIGAQAVLAGQHPLANDSGARAIEQGTMQVGGAIGQVGQVFSTLADKVQQAKNIADVADSENKMQAALAEHEAWKQQNPDPSGWMPHLQETLKSAQQNILSNDQLSPMAKDHLALSFAKTGGEATNQTMVQAAKGQFDRARSSLMAQAELAADSGDFTGAKGIVAKMVADDYLPTDQGVNVSFRLRDKSKEFYHAQLEIAAANKDEAGAQTILDAGQAHGVFKPYEAELQKVTTVRKIAQNKLRDDWTAAIVKDPAEASKQLAARDDEGNFTTAPDLSPELRDSLLQNGKRMIQTYRVDEAEELDNKIQSGEITKLSELEDHFNSRKTHLPLSTKQQFIHRMKQGLPNDPVAYTGMFGEIAGLDYNKEDPDALMKVAAAKEKIINNFQGPYRATLEAHLADSEKMAQENAPKLKLTRGLEKLMSVDFDAGAFNPNNEPTLKPIGNAGELDAQHKSLIEDQITRPDELKTKFDALVKGDTALLPKPKEGAAIVANRKFGDSAKSFLGYTTFPEKPTPTELRKIAKWVLNNETFASTGGNLMVKDLSVQRAAVQRMDDERAAMQQWISSQPAGTITMQDVLKKYNADMHHEKDAAAQDFLKAKASPFNGTNALFGFGPDSP
jgi:hypothetical protein